jgi:TonB family protein
MSAYKKYEIATFTKEHKEQDGRLWWHQLNHLENEMLKAITLRFHPRNGAVDNNVEAVLTLAANKVFVLPPYSESLYQDMHYGSREKPIVLNEFETGVLDGVSENGLSSDLRQLILEDPNVLSRLNSSQEFRFALYKKCLLIACNSKRNYLDETIDPSILTKNEEPTEPKSDNAVELKQEKLKKIIARISNIVHSRRNTYDIFKSYRVQFDGINSLESYPKIPSFKETEIMNLLREYCSGDSLEMRHFVFYIPPARSPDILGDDEKETFLAPRRSMPQVEIIDFPDVEASCPGGDTAMTNFIRETLIYPKRAIRNKIEGSVQLSFVVETDGSLTNIRVVRGVSDELDSEAKRIIQAMPKWGSAESHGKKIRKKFELKIVFELD